MPPTPAGMKIKATSCPPPPPPYSTTAQQHSAEGERVSTLHARVGLTVTRPFKTSVDGPSNLNAPPPPPRPTSITCHKQGPVPQMPRDPAVVSAPHTSRYDVCSTM